MFKSLSTSLSYLLSPEAEARLPYIEIGKFLAKALHVEAVQAFDP